MFKGLTEGWDKCLCEDETQSVTQFMSAKAQPYSLCEGLPQRVPRLAPSTDCGQALVLLILAILTLMTEISLGLCTYYV